MKLSGSVVPSADSMTDLGAPPWSRLFSAAVLSELLVMHNVMAMADIERAAFFAACS
jgi:hypothetical protein